MSTERETAEKEWLESEAGEAWDRAQGASRSRFVAEWAGHINRSFLAPPAAQHRGGGATGHMG